MILIPLQHGKHALIDDCDYDKVKNINWHYHETKKGLFYIEGTIRYPLGTKRKGIRRKQQCVKLHQVIMGKAPKGQTIDHKNRDGFNNTRDNLRFATLSQQMINQRIKGNNQTGFRGVTYRKDSQRECRWKAEIMVEKKSIQLGSFHTPIEAAKAYNKASLKYHGKWGYRNLIP